MASNRNHNRLHWCCNHPMSAARFYFFIFFIASIVLPYNESNLVPRVCLAVFVQSIRIQLVDKDFLRDARPVIEFAGKIWGG